ncbi:MAG: 1-acyl-sn-glycerol-3-phosphate acyltransferase [Verrucomicrobiales bacterium]|nr:1-acyl-sn-glycerol-3-phosphate acyltransferase [Verrucomicrobiales bacterium]
MPLHHPVGQERHRRAGIYEFFWRLSRIAAATYFRRREAGLEHIPLDGPVILAANHASFMDPPLIGASCPRALSYLARESLFAAPAVGWLLRSVGSVPVDRDGASGKGLKTILERLIGGEGIILFPEGTRTPDGRIHAGRAGIGLIVVKSKAPVVPARVFGTFEAWGRHRRLPLPKPVAVRFGPPMRFDAAIAEAESATRVRVKEIYQEVTDAIVAAIERLERP